MSKLISLCLIVLIVVEISSFNFSPIPNYKLKEPDNLKYFMNKVQSSYFGYTINLRKNSIIIGAPRAQSTFETQRKINETGAIYKCNLTTEECVPFELDSLGNENYEMHSESYNNVNKEKQWLGAAMDGHASDTDRLIACASNIITNVNNDQHFLFHGVCYLSENTETNKGADTRRLAPLRLRRKQNLIINQNNTIQYYMFGQMGFSVHITDNSEEILIGAPGVFNWKGTVVRYKAVTDVDLPGLSRRDLDNPGSIRRRPIIEFQSEVANPSYWEQDDDSYFGYAITSANFVDINSSLPKLLYVASAPQGALQTGEVVIFDFAIHPNNANDPTERSIKIYYKFVGTQMGEYFGYALLADDFNGDGLTDLAISAPFYGKPASYDNGKVYIYLNDGEMRFTEQKFLTSNYTLNGRFGMVLGKIGDINHDGYQDIAVGSPFEENGAVYIFLGGLNGLSPKPSQILRAPNNDLIPSNFISHMFGHGISKGVDIDNNGFNDLAIGAPNSDMAYVYRSYPVVKIVSSIASTQSEISTSDTKTTIKACWSFSLAKITLPFNVDLKLHIKLDPQLNRAKFSKTGSSEYQTTVTATSTQECVEFDIQLQYTLADIFKPIILELHHDLDKKFQDSVVFCEDCVAINPNDEPFAQNKIVFSTGCKATRCVADLQIKSKIVGATIPYILGSSKSLSIEYTVINKDETAYLAQLVIELPKNVAFYKIPSNCKQIELSLSCDLAKGRPLFTNDLTTFLVTIDTSKLDGTELRVNALVKSASDEADPSDNVIENIIPLAEFSEIEILGRSSAALISVEAIGLKQFSIEHEFEIRNSGPSSIQHLEFIVSIPLVFTSEYTRVRQTLIDFANITATGEYDGQTLDISWNHKNISNSVQNQPQSAVIVENIHGMDFDSSKIGLEYNFETENANVAGETGFDGIQSFRDSSVDRTFNRYTRQIVERHNISRRDVEYQSDTTVTNLPKNRVIYFNCSNEEETEHFCVHGKYKISNFRASDKAVYIKLNFTIDLSIVDTMYTESKDIFLMLTSSTLQKPNNINAKSLKIVSISPYTVVTKYVTRTVPIWAIILSILVGLLALTILTYVFYRMGFFKRSKKEEMAELTRQSQIPAEIEETTGLNSSDN